MKICHEKIRLTNKNNYSIVLKVVRLEGRNPNVI